MLEFIRKGQATEAATAAVRSPVQMSKSEDGISIKKADQEQQLVFGEVYAPGFPDSQGDFCSAETIRDMAYNFMKNGYGSNIDVEHTRKQSGAYVVESFIARDDDPTFIPGSWVIGVKVPDPGTWQLIKSGELNGFSLDGMGLRKETTLEIDMPELLKGETTDAANHRHTFFVKYDASGKFLGGQTSPGPDGHVHQISRGTATETVGGHNHRFSFVEGVLNAAHHR